MRWGVEASTDADASGGVTAGDVGEAGGVGCVLAADVDVAASVGVTSCSSSCSLRSVPAGPGRH